MLSFVSSSSSLHLCACVGVRCEAAREREGMETKREEFVVVEILVLCCRCFFVRVRRVIIKKMLISVE